MLCTICGKERVGIACGCNEHLRFPVRQELTVLVADTAGRFPCDVWLPSAEYSRDQVYKEYWAKVSWLVVAGKEKALEFGVKDFQGTCAYAPVDGVWRFWGHGSAGRHHKFWRYLITIESSDEWDEEYVRLFKEHLFWGKRS